MKELEFSIDKIKILSYINRFIFFFNPHDFPSSALITHGKPRHLSG